MRAAGGGAGLERTPAVTGTSAPGAAALILAAAVEPAYGVAQTTGSALPAARQRRGGAEGAGRIILAARGVRALTTRRT